VVGRVGQVLSRLLGTGVLCHLDAISVEWHDERHKGTRPIHAATGAPTNFSALLHYVLRNARQGESGPGACGVEVVDLQVDRT